MRLTDSQIVAGLGNPNLHVREVVADYLEDCGRTQADITRRLIAAVDQFGWGARTTTRHRKTCAGIWPA
jgi:hypothetical protein